jgi:hypothetical protein
LILSRKGLNAEKQKRREINVDTRAFLIMLHDYRRGLFGRPKEEKQNNFVRFLL